MDLEYEINSSNLCTYTKNELLKLNECLPKWKTTQDPIMFIVKELNNAKRKKLMRLITEMIKQHSFFNGDLKEHLFSDTKMCLPSKIIFDNGKGYIFSLNKYFIEQYNVDYFFNIIHNALTKKNVLILLEIGVELDDLFYKHQLFNNFYFIFANKEETMTTVTKLGKSKYNNYIQLNKNISNITISFNTITKIIPTNKIALKYLLVSEFKINETNISKYIFEMKIDIEYAMTTPVIVGKEKKSLYDMLVTKELIIDKIILGDKSCTVLNIWRSILPNTKNQITEIKNAELIVSTNYKEDENE